MHEYTTHQHIILREYGMHIQQLIEYIITVEDRQKRTKLTYTLVELVKMLETDYKENRDNNNRIWDDLFVISGFKLDVDSPFPMPSPELLNKKPLTVEYSGKPARFRHYGKNIELLIERACEIEDEGERQKATIYVGKVMKSFYTAWYKEPIEENVIMEQIQLLSKGKLSLQSGQLKGTYHLPAGLEEAESQPKIKEKAFNERKGVTPFRNNKYKNKNKNKKR